MPYSLIWLPQVLRAVGLKVAEVAGWTDRGRSEMATVRGIVCHHTGTNSRANMPTLRVLVEGRGPPDPLAGPLAQLGLGRDGTFYVIAAGLANHAGAGEWRGFSGNSNFIGIEAENSGTADDPWPEAQMDAYRRGVAAILARIGSDANMCCAHKEYAPGRKTDPSFEMDPFREGVRALMSGAAVVRPLIPADDGVHPTLTRGARGEAVVLAQRKAQIPADGIYGPLTEAAVREFQRANGLVPDGIVGPKTWEKIVR